MLKHARILLFLLLAVFALSGCTRTQAPSPSASSTTGNDVGQGFDIIPDSNMGEDWNSGDLELRAAGQGFGEGTYTDSSGKTWKTVEGMFPSIYFGFDSSAISASERSKLQEVAGYLKANPSTALLVEGHCDWYGTAEYNLALGDRRAESVANYLGTLGITPLRIDKLSKGSLEATSGLSKAQSAEDRRADLILLK